VITLDDADVAHVRAHYDAGVASADAWLGRLVEGLEARGLADDTILIVTSDHGIDLLEHGTLFAYPSQAPFQEILRVPLVLSHPALTEGVRLDAPVSLLDVYPTLLDLLGLPAPEGAEGASLFPLLMGGALPERDIICVGSPEREDAPDRMSAALVRDDAALLTYSLAPFDFFATRLYDLAADPGERRDRALDDPATLGTLHRALHAHARERGLHGLYQPPRRRHEGGR